MRRETVVAGVDGYRDGWVVVRLDVAGAVGVCTFQTFAEIAPLDVRVIAVDIPIGVPETGLRPADVAARRFVGGRASSVFPTPPRVALEAESFAEALARARGATGRGISAQSYALRRRILEVEAVARTDERVVEVHPEVSFAELAGSPLAHSKRTPEGLSERRGHLRRAGLDAAPARGVPEADLLDALVAAWSAARYRRGEARPLPPDHRGRIGAIWR